MHVSAEENEGEVIFLHKVKEGSVDKSYGINVAKLAGLPDEVINRASDILNVYENKEKKRDIVIQTSLPLDFNNDKDELKEKIKNINILELTPIQALNMLNELKESIK